MTQIIESAGPVRLSVYDAKGRLIAILSNEVVSGGVHSLAWDGRDSKGASVPSGVYVARLESSGEALTRKMILSR